MAEPDERIEVGPNGEPIFIKGGRVFIQNPESGEAYTVPETELQTLIADGASFMPPNAVLERLRQRKNADVRETEPAGRAFAESAGRAALDALVTPIRLLDPSYQGQAAYGIEGLTGRSPEAQRQSAEAFGEAPLGESNLGTVATDVGLALAGSGLASKALKGANLATRVGTMGAVDAGTGAIGGGAAAAESAFRAGEQLSADKLLAGMGQGALLGGLLGAGSELASAGMRGVLGKLESLDPTALRRGVESTADILRLGEQSLSGTPGIRIRTPKGADTPGAGYGALRRKVFGFSPSEAVRKMGRRMVGEASEVLEGGERQAKQLLKETELEIAAGRKASQKKIREADTRLRKAEIEARRAESALTRAERGREKLMARVGRQQEQASKTEATLRSRIEALDESIAAKTVAAGQAEQRLAGKLTAAETKLASLQRELEGADVGIGMTANARNTKLARLRAKVDAATAERDEILARQTDGSPTERLESERNRLQEELESLTTDPAWRKTEAEGLEQLEEEISRAKMAASEARHRAVNADAENQAALREVESLDVAEQAIRDEAELKAADVALRAREDAKGAFRKSAAFRTAATALEAASNTRNLAARTGVQGSWITNQVATDAFEAQDEIERRIDSAVQNAISTSPDKWIQRSGVDDYKNFPDLQFRRPGETRREAALARSDAIARAASNPVQLMESVALASESFAMLGPGLTQRLMESNLKAVNFLNRFLKTRQIQNPLQPTLTAAPIIDEVFCSAFERMWNATMFPGLMIDELATWSLTGETLQVTGYLYPEIYGALHTRMAELVFSGQFEPTYQQRVQLSALLGVPDSTLQPSFQVGYSMATQEALAEQQAAAQSLMSSRPGRSAGNPSFAQQNRTISQRVQEN